jgi:hypothetical protein
MISKISWHIKKYGMPSQILVPQIQDTQKLTVSQKSWIAMKICDTLLPNGMPCHHHMEN